MIRYFFLNYKFIWLSTSIGVKGFIVSRINYVIILFTPHTHTRCCLVCVIGFYSMAHSLFILILYHCFPPFTTFTSFPAMSQLHVFPPPLLFVKDPSFVVPWFRILSLFRYLVTLVIPPRSAFFHSVCSIH